MFPVFLALMSGWNVPQAAPPSSPETRALAYLAREVPRWSIDNKCHSCHHNGDAARVLYMASRSRSIPAEALISTTRWLEKVDGWDHNGGEGPFNDKKLARLRFAASLAEAHKAGLTRDDTALAKAAGLVAELQDKDGSWRVTEGALGSATTHGTALRASEKIGWFEKENQPVGTG